MITSDLLRDQILCKPTRVSNIMKLLFTGIIFQDLKEDLLNPKPNLLLLNIHVIKNLDIVFVVQSMYKASNLKDKDGIERNKKKMTDMNIKTKYALLYILKQ